MYPRTFEAQLCQDFVCKGWQSQREMSVSVVEADSGELSRENTTDEGKGVICVFDNVSWLLRIREFLPLRVTY